MLGSLHKKQFHENITMTVATTITPEKIKKGDKTTHCVIKHHVWLLRIRKSSGYPKPGRVAQSVGHLTRKSGVLGSIPGLATYFRFSFRFFKKGSCQLLAKVCARSTG